MAGSLDNLQSPLLMAPATTLAGHRDPRDEFRRVLHEAKEETDRFLLSLADLKPSADVDPMAQSLAQEKSVEIASQLAKLEQESEALADIQKHATALAQIRDKVDGLQMLAYRMPDFQRGVQRACSTKAQVVNRRGFWLDIGSGVIAVIFLLGLIAYGYVWVFSPLRKLHKGALGVAQGDFNYRVKLTARTKWRSWPTRSTA